MSKFFEITSAVLVEDQKFAAYLRQARTISAAKKGGTFVGSYEVAPDEFRKYGIVLPKGGMIIPDAEPKQLRSFLEEPDRLSAERDLAQRRLAEEIYHGQVKILLEESGIPGIAILVKDGDLGNWDRRASFIARGDEAIFSLSKETEPCSNVYDKGEKPYTPWFVWTTPLEKVQAFLIAEKSLCPLREMFKERLLKVKTTSEGVGHLGPGETGWDRPNVEFLLYEEDYSGDINYFGRRCSMDSVHLVIHRKKAYRLVEEEIAALEAVVQTREMEVKIRLERLWKLFVEAKGVFTLSTKEGSCYTGHSLLDGRARYDEWVDITFHVGGEALSEAERTWLNTRLGEIAVLADHVRVKNDTNDILAIPPVPGQNDVLVVVGKTGSRRGIWSFGEWYRGHPSKCQIDFWHKGTARKIKSITLNGVVQESYPNLSKWLIPKDMAEWALREAGIVNPSPAYVEAVASVYEKNLLSAKPVASPPVEIQEEVREVVTMTDSSQQVERMDFGTNLGGLLSGFEFKK